MSTHRPALVALTDCLRRLEREGELQQVAHWLAIYLVEPPVATYRDPETLIARLEERAERHPTIYGPMLELLRLTMAHQAEIRTTDDPTEETP